MDDVWVNRTKEETRIISGLRRLSLAFALNEYFSERSRWTTSLLAFVRLAAPNLTHLMLDAKGLTQDGIFCMPAAIQTDLGLLGFETFVGQLYIPHLLHFDLHGWYDP